MAANNDERRVRLFNFCSVWLRNVGCNSGDEFICPLCLSAFSRDGLTAENRILSLAHVIPEALGGTFCTLTCTQCNNSGGSLLEAALVARFQGEDAMVGVGTIDGRLVGDFGSIGVECRVVPDLGPWELSPVPRQSNPAEMHRLNASIDSADAAAPCALHIRYQHEPLRVSAAIYQSAYLLMFAYFGYEVVFDPRYDRLRQQIARPDIAILPQSFVLPPTEWVDMNFGEGRKHAIMFAIEPLPHIIAFMRFQPEHGRSRVLGARLPGLSNTTWPEEQQGHTAGILVRIRAEVNDRNQRSYPALWAFASSRFQAEKGSKPSSH